MKTYNIIRSSSTYGSIRKTIKANSYDDAVNIASEMFNCCIEDDHIIELASETQAHRELQTRLHFIYS